jgi:hypothetical protein
MEQFRIVHRKPLAMEINFKELKQIFRMLLMSLNRDLENYQWILILCPSRRTKHAHMHCSVCNWS